MLIGLWQFAHFPRRQHQLTIGMFWYQRIGAWQFGQCEGGNAMFSPRGLGAEDLRTELKKQNAFL